MNSSSTTCHNLVTANRCAPPPRPVNNSQQNIKERERKRVWKRWKEHQLKRKKFAWTDRKETRKKKKKWILGTMDEHKIQGKITNVALITSGRTSSGFKEWNAIFFLSAVLDEWFWLMFYRETRTRFAFSAQFRLLSLLLFNLARNSS